MRVPAILLAAAAIIALPFIFRPAPEQTAWTPGHPELVIVTPHNEAIRYEFARAFSKWHAERYGEPVRIDWRAIGGTSEIARYLTAQYLSSARAWWTGQGHAWRAALGESMVDRKFDLKNPPSPDALALWKAFRETDEPDAFGSGIDLFFGGGEYDHQVAFGQGLTVAPWPAASFPSNLFFDASGEVLIPRQISGESWWSETYFSAAASTFGICYNADRLGDLGLDAPPTRWADLADPRYAGTLGLADPTKSGSIAKAFELIVHEQCRESVRADGFSDADVAQFEQALKDGRPGDSPSAYQEAIEKGWARGIALLQELGANARYFTDSSSKIPIDTSGGQAAAGICIDFYGRFQAEQTRAPDGHERMVFMTPLGGTSASGDPISLLRGARHRVTAVRFIEFVLGEEGQKLWCYRPGTPGGPERFALRRLPVRRDFYPSPHAPFQAAHERHQVYASDPLADARINPYAVAESFTYVARWTGPHFNILRDLVRAMCIDSEHELKAAWSALAAIGGPRRHPDLAARLASLPADPAPFTWSSAGGYAKAHDRLDYMRAWTEGFRARYREVEAEARKRGGEPTS